MTDPADLRRQLANTIPTDDPAWRHALQSVPREIFLGDALFRLTGPQWEPIHRDQTAPGEWLRLIYQDTTWVTQIDGVNAADACSPTTGRPTSSSTLPSLIVRMLDLAGTRDGDNVLEIGTGTGYSTAILCERLGDEHVFSVEYDPGLAAAAADHIHAAGYHPTLNTGDGLAGHKDGAEYDAIIATCAVRHIPRPGSTKYAPAAPSPPPSADGCSPPASSASPSTTTAPPPADSPTTRSATCSPAPTNAHPAPRTTSTPATPAPPA
ncbi:hypothetical protein SAV14893_094920 [Streptomyces avermitilis]|uniref:Protein-L-isoaspartate O-methyltransferase n=1 Tax=Streptomyces avermitilis TaxID=33903 RepID=A0A4D4MET7_STRAX|nr:methyltransferase domain-containing protein [Streptomyces avermitilis]GDY70099.1 hypothetical protein SAV14893_094920 [Streptomyces avermitilis]